GRSGSPSRGDHGRSNFVRSLHSILSQIAGETPFVAYRGQADEGLPYHGRRGLRRSQAHRGNRQPLPRMNESPKTLTPEEIRALTVGNEIMIAQNPAIWRV